MDFQIFSVMDPRYPSRLHALPKPPDTIWIRGSWDETRPAVAVVGARASFKESEKIAYTLAYELAQAGVDIVSGGATGIDAAAHWGAIEAKGKTCAVLGTGVDAFYPKKNKPLFNHITQNGCLLSCFVPNAPPNPWHFPKRNHLIAAMCDLVVLVQSPPTSGSRYTASTAQLLKKHIGIIPGSKDTKDIESSGGIPIRSIDDIFPFLPMNKPTKQVGTNILSLIEDSPCVLPDLADLGPHAKQIKPHLGPTPQYMGDISHNSGLPLPLCAAGLLELELHGLCTRLPGERYLAAFHETG